MKLEHYAKRTCTTCNRQYETTDSESKNCPLCRMDEKTAEYDELPSRGKVTADGEIIKTHFCDGRCYIFYDEGKQYHVKCEKCGTVAEVTTTSLDNAIRIWNNTYME